MRISIITPSRGRPDKLLRMARSAWARADGPAEVEIIVGVDPPDAENYRRAVMEEINSGDKDFCHGMVLVMLPPDVAGKVGKAWDWMWKNHAYGDIALLGNDDIIFQTQGWDSKVYDAIESFPGRLGMVWCEDGINGGRHAAFPFVSRQWIEIVGHFTPGIFRFGYNDTWIFDVARRANLIRYLPEVTIEHLHFSAGKSPYDETYAAKRRDDTWESDHRLFERTAVQRDSLAAGLIEAAKKAAENLGK